MAGGLRDSAQALAPPWLSDDSPVSPQNPTGGIGGRLVYLIGLMGDALVDRFQQAIYARLPLGGTTSPSGGNGGPDDDALALIGADRVIVRGIGESATSFGGRLQKAFPTWQHAGQAITVMKEVLAYLQTECKIAVMSDFIVNGFSHPIPSAFATMFSVGADTELPPTRWQPEWFWDEGYGLGFAVNQANAYDGHPITMKTAWWRSWLVLWSVTPWNWTNSEGDWGDPGDWGDATESWGLSVPSTTIGSVRQQVGTFKCANTWYRWIVVSLDPLFADWSAAGAYYPSTGDWQHWSKVSTAVGPDGNTVPAYVPTRAPLLRYCDGVIDANGVT